MQPNGPPDSQTAAKAQPTPVVPAVAAPLGRNVRVLGLSSLINDIAGEMVFPLIPLFLIEVLGAGKSALGAVEGIADTTASIVKLFAGGLSDRLGRRKGFVVAGYALAAAARPLTALTGAAWQVVLVRSGDRFGKGIRSAPRDALVADSTDPRSRGRAFGFTRAMDHLGAAIGPLLAFGFLWAWPQGLRTLFLLTALPGLAVVLLVIFGLREPKAETRAGKEFSFTLKPFDRDFRLFLVALVVFTLGNSSDAFLLVRVHELGVAKELLPLVWCVFHIVKSIGSLLAGWAVDRVGPRPLIFAGWIVYAAIYLAFSLATTALAGWIFFLVYGAFHALTEPAERTLVANLVGPERTGLAYGWFNFAIGIAALPASLMFGVIYDRFGGPAAFSTSAALALTAVALLAGVRGQRPVAASP